MAALRHILIGAFIAFSWALPAHAQDIACTGSDLVARMAADDPDQLAGIREIAAEEPNGSGLLWRIEADGGPPSHLFGTMHMADPRVKELPEAARAAFDASDTVVIETLDVLDPAASVALMAEAPDLLMFTDSRTLDGLMEEDDREMVREALAARGVPLSSLRKTVPWLVSALVALPVCEIARQGAGDEVLDLALAAWAQDDGKRLAGLESLREQLEAMASLPMEFHMEGLVETARLGPVVDDVAETMVALYQAGDVAMIWPFLEAVLPAPSDAMAEQGYAQFQERLIVARNAVMAERALEHIEVGGAFIAVGALHLPGEEGLVALLEREGYTLSRVE